MKKGLRPKIDTDFYVTLAEKLGVKIMASKKNKVFEIVHLKISELKPHPDNYRKHPQDQLDHIIQSLKETGVYKNIVVTKCKTILAGHGVVEAHKFLKLETVPAVVLDIDPMSKIAKKILTGDNEIAKLGEVDDRMLTDTLKSLYQSDKENGLLGTGFNADQLANLVFVTRPESEIKDFNAALAWVGLPTFENRDKDDKLITLTITFDDEEGRTAFCEKINLRIKSKSGNYKWSTTYPYKERNDLQNVKFKNKGTEKIPKKPTKKPKDQNVSP